MTVRRRGAADLPRLAGRRNSGARASVSVTGPQLQKERTSVLRAIGCIVLVIFVIGLLVVFGLLDAIF